MDETHSPEEIKKRFEALPADIKTLVYSSDMRQVLQTVGTKFKLHIDQIGELEGQTADVMTGLTPPEDFASSLMETLHIDKNQADDIAKDISDQLFVKIRESMKRSYDAQKMPQSVAINKPLATSPTPAMPPAPKTEAKPTPLPPPPLPITPKPPEIHPADAMLTQKSVSVAPVMPPQAPVTAPKPPATPPPAQTEPPKPKPYTQDPYREPTN